jgi:hypothetical protein
MPALSKDGKGKKILPRFSSLKLHCSNHKSEKELQFVHPFNIYNSKQKKHTTVRGITPYLESGTTKFCSKQP